MPRLELKRPKVVPRRPDSVHDWSVTDPTGQQSAQQPVRRTPIVARGTRLKKPSGRPNKAARAILRDDDEAQTGKTVKAGTRKHRPLRRAKHGRLARPPKRGPKPKAGWWARRRAWVGSVFTWDGWLKLGAIATALGVMTGLIFTSRSAVTTGRQYALAQQTEVTGRFSKAIEQLGNETLDIRLGAIYSLQRIAKDSPNDAQPIMQILGAFIRGHSRFTPECTADLLVGIPDDVQAALTAILRRNIKLDEPIKLHFSCLQFADMEDADLTDLDFACTALPRANLRGAHAEYVNFEGADLSAADLSWAKLEQVRLADSTAVGATFSGADMGREDMARANLAGAKFLATALLGSNFSGANLSNTHFAWADGDELGFGSADLEDAYFAGAQFDSGTQWPGGYVPAFSSSNENVGPNSGCIWPS